MVPPASIVPSKSRIEERRTARRQNMRRALAACGASAVLAIGTALLLPAQWYAMPLLLAVTSGVVALLLRFTEQPRELVKHDVQQDPDRFVTR